MSDAATSKKQAAALNRAKRMARACAGVRGVDLGFVYRGGKRLRTRGVRFHVERKCAEDKLPDGGLLLPREIDGVPCDVVEAAYQPHAPSPRSFFDPIRPGISVGNVARQSTGTFGCIVYDAHSGAPCVLSNWHVLGGSAQCQPGELISQPGPRHLGSEPPRFVAALHKWANLAHGYDAAVALISDGVAADAEVFGSGLKVAGVKQPRAGMRLIKSGTSSETTHALVDGVDGTYEMDYSDYGDRVRWMDGIRLVPDPAYPDEEEISLSGDSGALWLEAATGMAVALHFAGEDGFGPLAEYAVAHPLPRVLQLLDVTIKPG